MIVLDGNSLTLADVVKVARGYEAVGLSDAGVSQIVASRAIVDKVLEEVKSQITKYADAMNF